MNTIDRLFTGSCFALITTALSFSILAGSLATIGAQLELTASELGYISSMWFLGFPLSMIVGGLLYNKIGGKVIMQFAFAAHLAGIILTVSAFSFWGLMLSTLLIGLGNGCTEAACNPMIADSYHGNDRNKMLNRFHMWFPGGIVIGSLLSQLMTSFSLTWQIQISVILIPTVVYLFLFRGQDWPAPKVAKLQPISYSIRAMFTPLFLFIFACMWLTSISEFGPQQWVQLTLKESGANPMIILALVTGLMAVARFYGGVMTGKFKITGVLLFSAIFTSIGIYLFSSQTGPLAYVAAIFFGLGIAYFWPNMLAFVAEYAPKTGALGLSVMGAVGMFSSAAFQPLIGHWIDGHRAAGISAGLSDNGLELFVGQSTMSSILLFPLILVVLFSGLYFYLRRRDKAAYQTSSVNVELS